MFVQSKTNTIYGDKNGIAMEQRRNKQETLVQWENGRQQWVATDDLKGTIRLVGNSLGGDEYYGD
jgi:hypothetical protein